MKLWSVISFSYHVVRVLSMVAPPPEEDYFFLSQVRSSSGFSSYVVFFSEHSTRAPTPLCLEDSTPQSTLSLLSHQVCTNAGFDTFSHFRKVSSSASTQKDSKMMCWQELKGDLSITCRKKQVPSNKCTSHLQVQCGPCHHNLKLKSDSRLVISSRLYPVLQPGVVCQWDIDLQGYEASLQVEDLSLGPPQLQPDRQCVNSFLHILAGDTDVGLVSISTLCGDRNRWQPFHLRKKIVRIQLVPGGVNTVRDKRGFLISLKVSKVLAQGVDASNLILFLVSTFVIFIFLTVFMIFVLHFARRVAKKRRRRIGVTWRGDRPQPGMSLQLARTAQMSRLIQQQENIYNLDYRVNVREERNISSVLSTSGRHLPDVPDQENESTSSVHGDDDVIVYESVSEMGIRTFLSPPQSSLNLEDFPVHTSTSIGGVHQVPVSQPEISSTVSRSYCPPPTLPRRRSYSMPSSPDYISLLAEDDDNHNNYDNQDNKDYEGKPEINNYLLQGVTETDSPRMFIPVILRKRLFTVGRFGQRLSTFVKEGLSFEDEHQLLSNLNNSIIDDVFDE